MNSIPSRILNNLRRPLRELVAYLADKIVSMRWKCSMLSVGSGFHVCGGALIQGGQHITFSDGFYAGQLANPTYTRQIFGAGGNF